MRVILIEGCINLSTSRLERGRLFSNTNDFLHAWRIYRLTSFAVLYSIQISCNDDNIQIFAICCAFIKNWHHKTAECKTR